MARVIPGGSGSGAWGGEGFESACCVFCEFSDFVPMSKVLPSFILVNPWKPTVESARMNPPKPTKNMAMANAFPGWTYVTLPSNQGISNTTPQTISTTAIASITIRITICLILLALRSFPWVEGLWPHVPPPRLPGVLAREPSGRNMLVARPCGGLSPRCTGPHQCFSPRGLRRTRGAARRKTRPEPPSNAGSNPRKSRKSQN